MQKREPEYFQDVETCVEKTLKKVGKNIALGLPVGLGKPNQLVNAFYRRALEDPHMHLRIITALSLEKPEGASDLENRFLGPFVERLFGGWPDLSYVKAIRKGTLPNNVEVVEFYTKPGQYVNVPSAQTNYNCTNYTFVPRDLVSGGVNVLSQIVCKEEPRPGDVRYSLSCNPDVSLDVMDAMRDKRRRGVKAVAIAQVNQNLPFMYGDAVVEPDTFDMVIDNPDLYFRLFGAPKMPVTTPDYMIGLHASALIKDGGTLQIGIGSLGDALVYGLELRQGKNDEYNHALNACGILKRHGDLIRETGGILAFHKGLYGSTEMLVDGYLHLVRSGVVRRQVYDHERVQELVNEGRLEEKITPEDLARLVEKGAVRSTLSREDFEFLQKYGIFREDLRYEDGRIVRGTTTIEADLNNPAARDRIHSECLGDRLKGGILIHAGFFLGANDFYQALRDMSEEERRKIWMTSVLHVNQLYENRYASEQLKRLQRGNARFVNASLMITLLGGVVSDGLENGQMVSGVGGQYNFVAMAHELPDARSIIMARSTRSRGGETRSNVVWNYGHLTIPRHLRDLVVTEYGIADLRGKRDQEVIAELLKITDSRFQDELLQKAKSCGKIPASYSIPDAFRNNLPERIEGALGPFRKKGMFPVFPFGTDFTKEELALGKALKGLKTRLAARKIPIPILKLDHAKKVLGTPEKARPYLERMGLDKPENAKEAMMQKLLVYALAAEKLI